MTAMDALIRCRQAWERSQPQLIFDLWDDRPLEGGHDECRVPTLEPAAVSPRSSPSGGLTVGADPCRVLAAGELTAAPSPGPAVPSTVDRPVLSSAPSTETP